MSTWTNITDNMVDADSPVTQSLMTAYRDNCIAIAEGEDANAPKVKVSNQDWNANTSNPTASQRNWILNRLKGTSVGSVGSYAMLRYVADPSYALEPGRTASGNELRYASAHGSPASASPPAGTWRVMGYSGALGVSFPSDNVTLYLRIA